MAKRTRRTREQIASDQIIKKRLNELGEIVYQQAVATSRRDTGRLQDEQNYRVKPDTTITFGQVFYGKFNWPKGVNAGEKNALKIAIKEYVPDTTKLIVNDINDVILKRFKDA